MASLRRAILALTLMGTVRVHGWDMWDLGRWSSVENDSASWDSLGGLSDVPEGEPVTDDVALNNTTYQLDAGDGFDDQSTPGLSHSPDVPSNDSYSGTDEGGERKEGGDESEGFGHQWLQKTMDFLSGLLSAPESGTDETNSTEIDSLQPDNLCLDGNTLSNCSSESVTPDQQLEDEELEEPDGDYPLTASMDTTASSEPTWIDASARCLRESMDRSDGRCDWEEGRTLEGALIDIFNDTIVKRLMKKCLPGEWCLHKHFSKHQTLAGHRSCHLMSCLEDWRDGNCPPTKVIWDALNLLCSLTNESTSDPCFISVLKMIHVTIADMIRVAVQPEVEESVCSEGNRDCSGPCQKVGQSLLCMSASCDNNTYQFESFGEWQWLFGQSGSADEKCQFNASECQLIETVFTMTSHDTAVMPHQGPRRLLTFLKDTEWSIIAGLILSVIFSLLVVCGIFLALRCSGRRRLRRRMMLRHKTMDRDDAGLTRDRIQYTIITTQQDDFDDQDSDDMA